MSNIVAGVNITSWATAPGHEENVAKVYEQIRNYISSSEGSPQTLETRIDNFIQNNPEVKKGGGSPVTGKMIMTTATKYNIDPALIMAIAQVDSHYGVYGKAKRTRNPGNWGNDDEGNLEYLNSWEEGIDKIGMQLDRYRRNNGNSSNYAVRQVSGDPVSVISQATKERWEKMEEAKKRMLEGTSAAASTSKFEPFVPSTFNSLMYKDAENKTTPSISDILGLNKREVKNEIPELYVSVFDKLKSAPVTNNDLPSKFVVPRFKAMLGGKLIKK